MKGTFVFDCETDGLNPTKIHCLSINNLTNNKRTTLTDYNQMRQFLTSAKVLIGHNIISFDIPQLERLLGIKVEAFLIDTLWISYYAFPEKRKHGLDFWGSDVGIAKPIVTDWSEQLLEVYVNRCEQDVEINTRMWNLSWDKLFEIYGSDKEAMTFVKYLSFKANMGRVQAENKWKLDIEHVIKTKHQLESELSEKIQLLQPHIPDRAIYKKKTRPKNLYKKDGSLSNYGVVWISLLESEGFDFYENPEIEEVTYLAGYEPGNLNSPEQVKDWLYQLGWVPETFKTNDKKQEVAQINLERGKGLCPSVKKLFSIEPALEYMEGISILSHRISILKGFLEEVDSNGYITASFGGLTNTLRYQHRRPCVNLPKVGLAYSEGIRASLIADEGTILCGSDMSGLEDRIKQHFIYDYDPEYVEEMQREDYDPHLSLALYAGKITKNQYDDYVSDRDTHTILDIRSVFKNGNYACQYGAFPPRLAKTCGISSDEAQELWEAYWSKNSSIIKVAESTKVKKLTDNSIWQQNPINGFWYSLRSDKDRFSTLVQGTASYVFDLWVAYVYEECPTLIAQFHDEWISRIKTDKKKWMEKVAIEALDKVNTQINLNVLLGCDIKFGFRYSDIH